MSAKFKIGKYLKLGILLSLVVVALTILPLIPLAIQYFTVKGLKWISSFVNIKPIIINFIICLLLLLLSIRNILRSKEKFINVLYYIAIYISTYSLFSFSWLGHWGIGHFVLLGSTLLVIEYLVIGIIKDKKTTYILYN